MKPTILVTGGAGFIGAHMALHLHNAGFSVVVLDHFIQGHQRPPIPGLWVIGSFGNARLLDHLFAQYTFSAVMHFGGSIQVGESVLHPAQYYQNNLVNTLTLLDRMRHHAINAFIFSSTAAIFGNPITPTIDETHPKHPINPYGRSKWMVEQCLADYERAYGLHAICLRYFNACGADPEGRLGECHEPETHLIPLLLQVAAGKRPYLEVFGRDYDTPDGTCIRDYIHVLDLCEAHLLALQHLLAHPKSAQYNLGNGTGFSVQEVIDTARIVTGKAIPIRDAQRRAGDPARLVANSQQAQQHLGWIPRYPALSTLLEHAWQWETRTA